MDLTIITALIAAVAALIGAVLGAGGTILTARMQHKLTTRSEREKEALAREKTAAERCSAHIKSMAKLTVNEQDYRDADSDAFVHRHNELQRLDDELGADSLYLPAQVQGRIELAREALRNANELVRYGLYYRSVGTIADSVADHMNEVLTAVVRGAPLPERSEAMRHLSLALDNLDDQNNQEYAQEVHEYEEEKRQWLVRNPEALPPAPPVDGRLQRLRRRVARSISPD
jgi:hypothetical protein